MLRILIYSMIFLGAALMIRNIIRYARFARNVRKKGDWARERTILYIPLVLLIGFFFGYVVVGLFGNPDWVIAGILFFGSVFVAIVVEMLQRVTDRIQANGQLEARLLAAEESNKAKISFMSNMSHEIRTPMNAIIGIDSVALRDPELSPHAREQFEKIDASARHLLGLINDILDMSRIDSGRMELKPEVFSAAELLEQVNEIIRSQCDEKGLTYLARSDVGAEERYVGDALKLKQVLINILGNAVKFTPVPGSVSFTEEKTAAYDNRQTLRFTVKDTGIGMGKDFLAHIFEPFSQEDGTRTSRYGGSGLGLSITKSIVDMMNGEILAESEKGVGTTFTVIVTLKRAESAAPAAQPPETADEAAALAGRRVLIAEDMELNAEILTELLELEDVGADWAENGQLAVERFSGSPPGTYDAILMDIRMPVMDGLAAARAIRALDRPDAKTIPIIALTANAFEEDVQSALQAGMNAHLSKPVDTDKLFAFLRELISSAPTGAADTQKGGSEC